jgi:adenylate kinase family enzyme
LADQRPRYPAEAEPTGTPETRLIILRGNSGSGKSTIARTVRQRYGRGCALVEQDYLRRIVLRERDVPGGHAPALIDRTVRFALDIGYHVICEGILHAARYRPVLTALHAAHCGTTSVFYLSASLDETLRRHCGRPQHNEFTTDDMRGWYVDNDLLGLPDECVIDEQTSLDEAVEIVSSRLPPPRTSSGSA